jgi:hypothetical protein
VSEHPLHRFDVRTRADSQARRRVPKVVRRNRRKRVVGLLALLHGWLEHPCPPIGVPQHPATRVGEHHIVAALGPTISAASSSASVAGNGSERRSQVFGVLHTSPPASVTERDAFTRCRSMPKSATRSAAVSPHRSAV